MEEVYFLLICNFDPLFSRELLFFLRCELIYPRLGFVILHDKILIKGSNTIPLTLVTLILAAVPNNLLLDVLNILDFILSPLILGSNCIHCF